MAGEISGIEELSYTVDTGSSTGVTARRFVKPTAETTVDQCDTEGEWALGVAKTPVSLSNTQGLDEVTAGKGVAVQVHGVAWVEASEAIAIGVEVGVGSDGTAITADSGDYVAGRCLKATSDVTVNLLVLVQLSGGTGYVKPA